MLLFVIFIKMWNIYYSKTFCLVLTFLLLKSSQVVVVIQLELKMDMFWSRKESIESL
uniref:Uncharacterized protein n=1 Tax=Brassica campestris TaxID=3711 RepID=A0A3P5YTK3_BRACM|nr:unnamed protein product [Brassica rapa]